MLHCILNTSRHEAIWNEMVRVIGLLVGLVRQRALRFEIRDNRLMGFKSPLCLAGHCAILFNFSNLKWAPSPTYNRCRTSKYSGTNTVKHGMLCCAEARAGSTQHRHHTERRFASGQRAKRGRRHLPRILCGYRRDRWKRTDGRHLKCGPVRFAERTPDRKSVV